ncbi:RNA 2',3'-cyclic phosphodiesterase [Hahella ganghwensis]|uniref:RNA 2',3'-cyclic phosphodiesterase n=1 Tax=Hahella ganghwensis TaxID=286420 RepID=UPI000365838A|nr:RNA 2',3'-cyclic phosphodiesterase [Hahella ganghwensis]
MRCFLGITPEPEIVSLISAHIQYLKQTHAMKLSLLRWQSRQQLHITLLFLGETSIDTLSSLTPDISQICKEFDDIKLSTAGIRLFPSSRRPRCLTMEIQESSELTRLHDEVAAAAHRIGFPLENRQYRPHITLARINHRLKPDFAHIPELPLQFNVGKIALFSSHTAEQGSRYEVEAEYPFNTCQEPAMSPLRPR